MSGYSKTFLLMAAMTALFMGLGALLGGGTGALIAFAVAAAMNLFAFWGSDAAVLRMHGAREVSAREAPDLVGMVHEMADRAGLPRPKVYIIDQAQPNAFATGRSPQHSAVAATTGLLAQLSREEVAGVMAHELAHIANRDTLIMTITATFAGAISMLANFALFFGNRDRPMGVVGSILMMILAPLAASIVQMAISRAREYEADKLGAQICGNPEWLASALMSIERGAQSREMESAERNPATAHMFIINPLHPESHSADKLFSTHPNTANRVARLMAMVAPKPRGSRFATAPMQSAGRAAQGSSIPRSGGRRGGGTRGGPWA